MPPAAAAKEREIISDQLGRELQHAVAELRGAKTRGDADTVRALETKVIPALMSRVRIYGVATLPKGIKQYIKVDQVAWNGEHALQHLESLGFAHPTSEKKLALRVRTFVRDLVLGGKGDMLPENLFSYRIAILVGVPKS